MYPDSIDRLCELTRKPDAKQRQHIAFHSIHFSTKGGRHDPNTNHRIRCTSSSRFRDVRHPSADDCQGIRQFLQPKGPRMFV